jgi:hypothetical protein
MARLNPAAQAEADRPRSEAEILAVFTSKPELNFNKEVSESTRQAFEDDLIKAYLPIGLPEEELREQYLLRNPHFPDDYLDPHVALEWTGWKNGVMYGYQI